MMRYEIASDVGFASFPRNDIWGAAFSLLAMTFKFVIARYFLLVIARRPKADEAISKRSK